MGIKEKIAELTDSAKEKVCKFGAKTREKKREIGAAAATGIISLTSGYYET